ncbi:FAD:protein FMN transferase [Sphingobium amiense]|uniref:FAD:protein FMN transferase n=1 Tax=Sphingobium amiense TaxID=135719 RepID=A0A494WCF1_9SPHN|nr:FAD:protein FMN transferase [Sphingobium amiense]BBD98205.1 FAD:protein FMN transferase [Sphingobium amiense]
MGTSWSAQIVDPPEECAATIETVLARVIDQMSNWEADSAISRFNRTPVGEWMALPRDMLTVLGAALEVARLSDGAFDPAVGRMVAAWGFGPGTADAAPATGRAHPWTAIEMGDERARRLADVALDFSGIAKGFAVDAVAEALRGIGVDNGLVEIGGELRGIGVKPDIQPWWVDMETPPDIAVPPLRVALSGLAVATSGDYRRFRVAQGRRLSHNIDPATGEPVVDSLASVTVLHDSAMMADAWATAILVSGAGRGMALAQRHGLAARLIERAPLPREHLSPALAAMLD